MSKKRHVLPTGLGRLYFQSPDIPRHASDDKEDAQLVTRNRHHYLLAEEVASDDTDPESILERGGEAWSRAEREDAEEFGLSEPLDVDEIVGPPTSPVQVTAPALVPKTVLLVEVLPREYQIPSTAKVYQEPPTVVEIQGEALPKSVPHGSNDGIRERRSHNMSTQKVMARKIINRARKFLRRR